MECDKLSFFTKILIIFHVGENEGGKVKEYSWDKKRENVDASKYIVQQLTTGSEEVRLPGSINGELRKNYRAFHRFGRAKFANGGQVLGSSQFSLQPQLPYKMMLASKVVKIDSKIIISFC